MRAANAVDRRTSPRFFKEQQKAVEESCRAQSRRREEQRLCGEGHLSAGTGVLAVGRGDTGGRGRGSTREGGSRTQGIVKKTDAAPVLWKGQQGHLGAAAPPPPAGRVGFLNRKLLLCEHLSPQLTGQAPWGNG